jgi:hypothetical protein
MGSFFLQPEYIDFSLQDLYTLLQFLILLKHLTASFLIILDLVLEIEKLRTDVFGPDEVRIHFNDAL